LSKLLLAHDLADSDPDAAYQLCSEILRDDPNCAPALYIAGCILCKADKQGLALAMFERCARLNDKAEAWNGVGTAYHELHQAQEARQAFRRAYEKDPKALYLVNLGVTYADEGNHLEALKWIRKAERMDPSLANIAEAAAFSELATGDWLNGWKHYATTLGGRFRKKLNFGGRDWQGEKVGTLILYGEQGLGDEIMYASCIEDCRPLADRIIIECDPRLEGLYRRSFPWAEVHGTRRNERPWLDGCDAQASVGSLPSLFRPSPESCPKKPYIVPDPERRLMWRALFDSWKKPVIGIAWSGGKFTSQLNKRTVGLESFRPFIESRDAVFVSLQYKDPSEEIAESGLPVKHFAAAMSDDYDDAAAMIAELDGMVGIHTTAHHVRGAMGLPSTVLVPHAPLWNYCHGDRMAWYQGQVYHRQRKDERWIDTIKRLDDPALLRL
jgi:hypothetical protein